MKGQAIFKLMSQSPRLPKPWEASYQEAQDFIAWADAIPDSTSRALLPMVWAVKDKLAYQDGGGLNGYLKERGMSKKGWKALNSLSVEQTADAFSYFRARGEQAWPLRLVRPAETARDAAVDVSAALLIVLADAEVSLEGIHAPYDEDWKLMIRALAAEVAGKALACCPAVAADAILVRDYLTGGDADISPSTSWSEMVDLAREWLVELQHEEAGYVPEPAAQVPVSRAVPTPGGEDRLLDAQTGVAVVRLLQFSEFRQESDLMNHCIGRSNHYFNKHMEGTGAFYSFREPGVERPLATLELSVSDGEWRICQCRGPFNGDPGPECHDLANRLLEAHQVGGEIRKASYEVVAQAVGQHLELEQTSTRYF
ncbi:PcfJ domain-containing protein [Pseudomonas aeruginosa]|uniref:PcfJ domain-containing protein n=1 Tax=Pseudomonas aeruginosa TaxID=287 RepID=UPI00093978FB|nr:PcfJ domain-containing protein [Pseudomonas aeruginosa]